VKNKYRKGYCNISAIVIYLIYMIPKKTIIAFYFILLSSCSVIGQIQIPGAHTNLESLWIRTSERRVVYRPVEYIIPEYPSILTTPYLNELQKENMMTIRNNINTSMSRFTYKRVPIGRIYFSYYEQFSFHIMLSNLNHEIDKITLRECYMIINDDNIVNILELPIENISQHYTWYTHDRTTIWGLNTGRGSGLLRIKDPIQIVIEKRENEYMDEIRFNFTNIPINYMEHTELKIIFELELYINGEINIIEHMTIYKRIFEEYIHDRSNNTFVSIAERIWNEISKEEWLKYL